MGGKGRVGRKQKTQGVFRSVSERKKNTEEDSKISPLNCRLSSFLGPKSKAGGSSFRIQIKNTKRRTEEEIPTKGRNEMHSGLQL